jgi:hypothetical protein
MKTKNQIYVAAQFEKRKKERKECWIGIASCHNSETLGTHDSHGGLNFSCPFF